MLKKTVYVLGAGYSVDGGAPKQSEIINQILALPKAYPRKYKKTVENWVQEFKAFLTDTLDVLPELMPHFSLEDVYTPIDRAIQDKASFRNYSAQQLIEKRDIFNKLIILALRNSIKKNSNTTNELLAKHLCEESKIRLKNIHNDPVSVITTNWDITLDNEINNYLQIQNTKSEINHRGVLDYCCYISSLNELDQWVESGLFVLGQGGYNVKLIKLHGSMNWLQCPRCNRLYVKLYKRWSGGYVFDHKYCYHCKRNYHEEDNDSFLLQTVMIMPTFLKNLENLQLKLLWMNAAHELSEASHVVFLGHSLSEADFEFKQLLSRTIRKDATIESVLIEDDNPDNYSGRSKYKTAGYRYESFFSGRKLKMHYSGVSEYLKSLG
ncbi:MAG TPA: hypothetical protein PK147_04370 [Saprospiraceae bacterium]|nr:hypothetical protein [Saprospiraceae bacterium]HPQ21060.1 hypothetical protein [Saprospiraceae bacterium]HRX29538.1 hypothetical protein [Saprospiraceae bacterium]